MSDFTVNTGTLRSSASELEGLAALTMRISGEIREACGRKGADSESMREALSAALVCGQSIQTISSSIKNIGNILHSCAELYESCENKIADAAVLLPKSIDGGNGSPGGVEGSASESGSRTSGSKTSIGALRFSEEAASPSGKQRKVPKASVVSKPGGNTSQDSGGRTGDKDTSGGRTGDKDTSGGRTGDKDTSGGTPGDKDTSGGSAGDKGKKLAGIGIPPKGSWKYDFNKPLYTWTYPGEKPESDSTQDSGKQNSGAKSKPGSIKPSGGKLYEWEIGTEASAALAEGKIRIPGGSVRGSFGNADAHASAGASLYMTGKDGNKTLAPYVSAEAGASVSLLEGKISGKYGNDFASISGKGDASVGSAEVSGSVSASLFDRRGNISPGLSGSVSAEAVAAQASATVTGSIAGARATIRAGASVGIGAHADIAVSPTAISCDVGASLGVGARFGFTIDISEAVEAVCSAAEAVWNYLFPGGSSG